MGAVTVESIGEYAASFGVESAGEEGTFMESLVRVDAMASKYPDAPLVADLKEAALVGAASAERTAAVVAAVEELLRRFEWALPLVSDPGAVESVRRAVAQRRTLKRCVKRLGDDYREDVKALTSAATRVMVEHEKRGDDGLLRVTGHLLLKAAQALADKRVDPEFCDDMRALFVGA